MYQVMEPRPSLEGRTRKVKTVTLSFYPQDIALLEELAAHLGHSKSETVRTALRLLASQSGLKTK